MARKQYSAVLVGDNAAAARDLLKAGIPSVQATDTDGLACALETCTGTYALVFQHGAHTPLAELVSDLDAKEDFVLALPAACTLHGERARKVYGRVGQVPPDCAGTAVPKAMLADTLCCAKLSYVRMVGLPRTGTPLSDLAAHTRTRFALSSFPAALCFGQSPERDGRTAWEPPAVRVAERLDDTAAVVVHWGRASRLRNAAARCSLEWIHRHQRYLPRMVFIEMQTDGQPGEFADMARMFGMEYLFLAKPSRYGDLFQKEALFNLAVKRFGEGVEAWIFQDSDILPTSGDYYRRYRQAILDHPDDMVQGFSSWRDSRCGGWQVGLGCLCDRNAGAAPPNGAPGLVWGTSGANIRRGTAVPHARHSGFFNPWCFSGSGDCCMIFEHIRQSCYGRAYSRHMELDWFNNIVDLEHFGKGRARCLDEFLGHVHHGDFRDRAYNWSRRFMSAFGDIGQWADLDPDGLLRWKRERNIVRAVVRRKPDLRDRESTLKVIAEETDRLLLAEGKSREQRP